MSKPFRTEIKYNDDMEVIESESKFWIINDAGEEIEVSYKEYQDNLKKASKPIKTDKEKIKELEDKLTTIESLNREISKKLEAIDNSLSDRPYTPDQSLKKQ